MRSADIAARCREIALRVQCSGEWGELAETLTQAAAEVERLRMEPSVAEEIVAWSVDLHDAREENKRLTAEVERLRLSEDELCAIGRAENLLRTVCLFDSTKIICDVLLKLLYRYGGGK